MRRHKIPQSVLVLIHTPALQVLLIRRADTTADFWQSVTGSKDSEDEPWARTAAREVHEETGIDVQAEGHALTDWRLENVYEIYPSWRSRYAPGVTHNTEHLFGLRVPRETPVRL
ncbi:MAG: dihydroneopterin triphosphate diphosphatase, partial [Proteobacteria bacterium]|nr:dihydroneopterin triphosphate diphosphatase [Pseudomonadota bacterium]